MPEVWNSQEQKPCEDCQNGSSAGPERKNLAGSHAGQEWPYNSGFVSAEVLLGTSSKRIRTIFQYKLSYPVLCLPSKCSFSEFMEDDCGSSPGGCGLVGSGCSGKAQVLMKCYSGRRAGCSGPHQHCYWRVILRARCAQNQRPSCPLSTPLRPVYQKWTFSLQKQNAIVSQEDSVTEMLILSHHSECCWERRGVGEQCPQLGPVAGLIGSPVPIPHHLPL